MYPCNVVITKGEKMGNICGIINCKKHNNMSKSHIDILTHTSRDDSSYCPIIIANGKNKGKMCCNPLYNSNKKCYLHSKKRLPPRNITFRKCSHIYDFTNLYKDIHSNVTNFKYSNNLISNGLVHIPCNIYTRNRNGLCNFHNHMCCCPCSKHKLDRDNTKMYKSSQLHELLYMDDICDIIRYYLTYSYIKLLNCTNHLLAKKTRQEKINPFTNKNTKIEIVAYVRHHINLVNTDLSITEKKDIVNDIFNYLVNNKKFLFDHPKFAITVYNKCLEFKKLNELDNIDYYIQKIFYQ